MRTPPALYVLITVCTVGLAGCDEGTANDDSADDDSADDDSADDDSADDDSADDDDSTPVPYDTFPYFAENTGYLWITARSRNDVVPPRIEHLARVELYDTSAVADPRPHGEVLMERSAWEDCSVVRFEGARGGGPPADTTWYAGATVTVTAGDTEATLTPVQTGDRVVYEADLAGFEPRYEGAYGLSIEGGPHADLDVAEAVPLPAQLTLTAPVLAADTPLPRGRTRFTWTGAGPDSLELVLTASDPAGASEIEAHCLGYDDGSLTVGAATMALLPEGWPLTVRLTRSDGRPIAGPPHRFSGRGDVEVVHRAVTGALVASPEPPEGACAAPRLDFVAVCAPELPRDTAVSGQLVRWDAEGAELQTLDGESVEVWVNATEESFADLPALAAAGVVTLRQSGGCDGKGGFHAALTVHDEAGTLLLLSGSKGQRVEVDGWSAEAARDVETCPGQPGGCSESEHNRSVRFEHEGERWELYQGDRVDAHGMRMIVYDSRSGAGDVHCTDVGTESTSYVLVKP